ncbi:MAG TPA: VOC family protein [Stellaceae bacterium]|nr:VOC family protein [Stellaceae bacterium]
MPKMIYVNLPVGDVERSAAFYDAVGFARDQRFSRQGSAAAMTWSDTIVFMLLSRERFADFTAKTIIDARSSVEALLCLSRDSRAEVDAIVEAARAAGGKADPCPKQDHGFVYGRSFEDLDGHVFEAGWMDVDAALAAMGRQQTEAA